MTLLALRRVFRSAGGHVGRIGFSVKEGKYEIKLPKNMIIIVMVKSPTSSLVAPISVEGADKAVVVVSVR